MSTTETVNIDPALRDALRDAGKEARVEKAARELEMAHHVVGDAAGNWADDENEETKAELREAVKAWREAGETFHRVMRGA